MKLNRFSAALCVLATGALALSGCGSDNKASSPSGSSGANVSCGGKQTLKASGSTAQQNAMTRFANAFEQACPGQTLNYTPNGSGAGISEFTGNQTDFGGSDSELLPPEYDAAAQRCGSPAWNLPVVFGPIAITYNVNGVTSLNLDGPTAAKIFNGAVAAWNDPAIAALNPGVALPAEPIRVIFRSDESGTSDNFQKYLDTASAGAWGKGAGKTFKGGVGEGAKGNDGTAAAVKNSEGAITYNEWSFAQAQHLNMAKIITSAGPDPVATQHRLGGEDDRLGLHHQARQRPRSRHDLVLPAQPDRRLSDRAGDLRDRLLEVSRSPGRYGGEGVPAEHDRRRPEWLGGQRIYPNSRHVQVEVVGRGQRHRLS